MAAQVGVPLQEQTAGLKPEFVQEFVVHGDMRGGDGCPVPEGVQDVLLRHLEASGRDWGLRNFLSGNGQITLSPEGVRIDLSRTQRPRRVPHLEAIVGLAEDILKEVAR
jgi:hypothetical protein